MWRTLSVCRKVKETERSTEGSGLRNRRRINYCEEGDEEEEDGNDELEQEPVRGLIFDPSEPDYLNYHDQEEGAQVVLTMEEVHDMILEQTDMSGDGTGHLEQSAYEDPYVRWLTTRQIGWALEEEQNELVHWRHVREGKTTARYIAPVR